MPTESDLLAQSTTTHTLRYELVHLRIPPLPNINSRSSRRSVKLWRANIAWERRSHYYIPEFGFTSWPIYGASDEFRTLKWRSKVAYIVELDVQSRTALHKDKTTSAPTSHEAQKSNGCTRQDSKLMQDLEHRAITDQMVRVMVWARKSAVGSVKRSRELGLHKKGELCVDFQCAYALEMIVCWSYLNVWHPLYLQCSSPVNSREERNQKATANRWCTIIGR